MKIKKHSWSIIFIILLIATLIDLFIPDPIIFIDEVALIAATIFALKKSISK